MNKYHQRDIFAHTGTYTHTIYVVLVVVLLDYIVVIVVVLVVAIIIEQTAHNALHVI